MEDPTEVIIEWIFGYITEEQRDERLRELGVESEPEGVPDK